MLELNSELFLDNYQIGLTEGDFKNKINSLVNKAKADNFLIKNRFTVN